MSAVTSPPPSFEQATNLRQKVRASGLDPDYWYAVEEVRSIKPGTVVEIIFWKRSIALYRATDGSFHALENRCAHRQIKLSLGDVQGCKLVCTYHGWQYDQEGRRVDIVHDASKGALPKPSIRAYPVKVRYGLVWLFPGNPERAESRQIPDIPELEGPERWACVPLSFTWHAHHSMIVDNVCDFTHVHLHRRYRPFEGAIVSRCETVGDNVHLSYDTKVGRGRISGRFVDHKQLNTNHMELCFEYPYQWSDTDGAIKHWLFLLPIDERTTRVFFMFYFKSLKIPMLPVHIPRFAMSTMMRLSNRMLIVPLLDQDRYAVEAEQQGYEKHWDAPPIEFNPVVKALQNVTVRKWQEYLAREAENGRAVA
ncbi:MAG: aromatic ring-hydroxylating dioxygenase subunit alpha [Proteobacteria bacterium]|nr:aromatic ring-hydroxylating dioxygenase subunit alpha [Pseudomonadota bacterium]